MLKLDFSINAVKKKREKNMAIYSPDTKHKRLDLN